jgi:MFS family permease
MGDLTSTLRATRVRLGVLGFMCSLSLLTYIDRICIMRVRGEMQRDLGFGDTDMGWIFAAFLLGYALFEVPGGWMGDMWGSRRVLTRIVLLWSIFTALTGAMYQFSENAGLVLAAMLVVRFFFGVGEAGAYPNIARITHGWFPAHEWGRVQGFVWMSARLGGAVAPLIIGRLTAVLGWRLAFVVLGSVGAIWAAFFYTWFRDRPEDMESCNEAERDLIRSGPGGSRVVEHGHLALPWDRLVFMPSVYMLCAVSALVSFGWYFYATWQPKFFQDVFDVNPNDSELITGLPFIFGACGSLLGGRLSDQLIARTGSRRWGRSLMGISGFTAAGICFISSSFCAEWWQAMLLLCLASFFNDLGIPPIWAACADIGGRYSGTLSGIMNMAGGIGSVSCPIVIPYLNRALMAYPAQQRWIMIFSILSSAWFIGAAAWACINAGRPIEEPMKDKARIDMETAPPPESDTRIRAAEQ